MQLVFTFAERYIFDRLPSQWLPVHLFLESLCWLEKTMEAKAVLPTSNPPIATVWGRGSRLARNLPGEYGLMPAGGCTSAGKRSEGLSLRSDGVTS